MRLCTNGILRNEVPSEFRRNQQKSIDFERIRDLSPKDISKKVVKITQLLGDEGGASPLQHSKDHLDLIETAWSMIWSAERNPARFAE